jgi:hypothetical protein
MTTTQITLRTLHARLQRWFRQAGGDVRFGHSLARYGLYSNVVRYPDGRTGWITHEEAVARELGVIAADEVVDHTPKCTRCKTRTPARRMGWVWGADGKAAIVPIEPPRYHRQCERCTAWSRATRRDVLRCLDCRRSGLPMDRGVGRGSEGVLPTLRHRWYPTLYGV